MKDDNVFKGKDDCTLPLYLGSKVFHLKEIFSKVLHLNNLSISYCFDNGYGRKSGLFVGHSNSGFLGFAAE